MVPRELIATAALPNGGEVRLVRRGDEWSIMLGANELMNSRKSGSEEALATLACARLATDTPRVLIGGLGMGFTLRAALGCLGPRAQLVVAELILAVVEWARGPMAQLHVGTLNDPRVTIVEGDVRRLINDGGWDAILLDVDNGPDGLTMPANDWLYAASGLAAIRRALRPGGVLAVWSATPDVRFERRLGDAGYALEAVRVRAVGLRGAHHVIWLAVPKASL